MPRWFVVLRLRARSLFRGTAVERSLQAEIQTHIDEQIAEHIAAGMSAAEARVAAIREFGPIAQIQEDCRDQRRVAFFDNLGRDFRYTLRSLRRQPLLVTAATLSIAVAVGANTTIFKLASELLFSMPSAQDPGRLVRFRMSGGNSHVSYRAWQALQETDALKGLAGYQIEIEVNWRGPSGSISLLPLIVTSNFFDVIGAPVAMGRGFTSTEAAAERHPDVAVISHRFWQTRLGADSNVVGTTLVFNGRPYTVLGVLAAKFRALPGYGVAPEVYLPLSSDLMPDLYDPHAAVVELVGRLHAGQTVAQGRAAIAAAGRQLEPLVGDPHFGDVSGFSPAGGFGRLGDFKTIGAFFAALLTAVCLVLAIACANVAGLLLARGMVRRRETAVRVALGASRSRLVQQLLTEGLWLALSGTVAGLLLMVVLMDLVCRVSLPLPLPIELHADLDWNLAGYSAMILILTTIFSALVPALQATRPSVVPALKQEEPHYAHRRWTLRGLLVIGQVTVAVVLLLTAWLFLRNVSRASGADPGFNVANTIVAQTSFVEGRYTSETRAAFLQSAVDRLKALPGVEQAAYARGVPLTMRSGATTGADLRVAEGGNSFQALYQVNLVAPAYFSTMGIPVLKGREFSAADRPGAPVVAIINEEFARRYFPDTDPIGRHLLLPGAEHATYPAEIVAVVGNNRYRTIGETQQPALYEAYLQRGNRGRVVHILVRTRSDSAALVHDVQQALTQMDTSSAVEVQPMRSALAFAFMPSRIGAALFGVLGVLGLALAMVGLYAVMSYAVSRRTAEIGIRMALGASRTTVFRLVLSDAGLLAGLGLALGLGIAALVTRPLAAFLVTGLSPSDPVSFAGTALLVTVVSLSAAWTPARRALRIDPATALRGE
jgi:putative ABC transport system permease protein